MKQAFVRPEFVEFIPEKLENGVLYVSQRYRTATHLCCCGCGEEVVTPLGPTDWSLQCVDRAVTLYPSIGNWSYACRSHYWIRNGKVIWAASMTRHEIERGRMLDQRQRDVHFSEINQHKELPAAAPSQKTAPVEPYSDWVTAIWQSIKRWWG